jgi:hypothetical protein
MATATVIPKLWNEPDCSTLGGRLGGGLLRKRYEGRSLRCVSYITSLVTPMS